MIARLVLPSVGSDTTVARPIAAVRGVCREGPSS